MHNYRKTFCLTLLAVTIISTPVLAQEALIDVGSTGVDGDLVFDALPPSDNQDMRMMVYDSLREVVVRYDGLTGLTWEFDGNKWISKQTENFPTVGAGGRHRSGMAYDQKRNVTVLFGGRDSVNTSSVYADTWEYDGTDWTERATTNAPSARDHVEVAYDPVREVVLLTGGYNYGTTLDGLWQYNGVDWLELSPISPIPASHLHRMAFDVNRGVMVLVGEATVYEWDGIDWTDRGNAGTYPVMNRDPVMYHYGLQKIVVLDETTIKTWNGSIWETLSVSGGGTIDYDPAVYDISRNQIVALDGRTTRIWDENEWSIPAHANTIRYVDMTDKPDGIYNYTSITVPEGVTIKFIPNEANTPVTWLSSGDVDISGHLDLTGEAGYGSPREEDQTIGGPGGGRGGLGGITFSLSGNYAGTPGEGPGGGRAGISDNHCGGHAGHSRGAHSHNCHGDVTYGAGSYGNSLIRPLQGGSGGGGSATMVDGDGLNGGSGGGAILLATNTTLNVNGTINVSGGTGEYQYYSSRGHRYGGRGSAGSIRLVASRIEGSGNLYANNYGRIRTESFYVATSLGREASDGSITGTNLPFAEGSIVDVHPGAIQIVSVDGVAVAAPPQGNTDSVDVIFANEGEAVIALSAPTVPEGTVITVRIYRQGGNTITVNSTPTDATGDATATVVVPAGVGRMQASAIFAPPIS